MNIFYTFQDYKPEKHDYAVVLSIYMAVPVNLNKVRYRSPFKNYQRSPGWNRDLIISIQMYNWSISNEISSGGEVYYNIWNEV